MKQVLWTSCVLIGSLMATQAFGAGGRMQVIERPIEERGGLEDVETLGRGPILSERPNLDQAIRTVKKQLKSPFKSRPALTLALAKALVGGKPDTVDRIVNNLNATVSKPIGLDLVKAFLYHLEDAQDATEVARLARESDFGQIEIATGLNIHPPAFSPTSEILERMHIELPDDVLNALKSKPDTYATIVGRLENADYADVNTILAALASDAPVSRESVVSQLLTLQPVYLTAINILVKFPLENTLENQEPNDELIVRCFGTSIGNENFFIVKRGGSYYGTVGKTEYGTRYEKITRVRSTTALSFKWDLTQFKYSRGYTYDGIEVPLASTFDSPKLRRRPVGIFRHFAERGYWCAIAPEYQID